MRRSSYTEQHPALLLLGIAVIITYWPIFVAAGAAYGVYLTARTAVTHHGRRRQTHATIAARADYEHSALLRGDTWRGTFGRYQPAPWWRT